MNFSTALWVFLGGGLGSVCRWALGQTLTNAGWPAPYPTLAINVLGSVLIGFLMAMWSADEAAPWRWLAVVGFCGGFTTFSTFSLENVQLLADRRYETAAGYMVLSLALSIFGTWLGLKFGVSR